jgi:hypothetical protein
MDLWYFQNDQMRLLIKVEFEALGIKKNEQRYEKYALFLTLSGPVDELPFLQTKMLI